LFFYREYSEQSGILKLMGEYRARCLFSKNWNLRDAVLLKIQQLIDTEYRTDLSSAIPPVCAFLKVGVEDKMQQVVITAVKLLEQVLKAAKRYRTSIHLLHFIIYLFSSL
jgi:hypothetical protein